MGKGTFDIQDHIEKRPPLWYLVFIDFFETDAIRKTSKGALLVGAYTLGVDYLETRVLHVDFYPPYSIFYLLGLVLGLLLVFRTNTAYDRWWTGRKLISQLSNVGKTLSSKLNALLDEEDVENREFFASMIANHAFAMKEVLRFGVKFDELIELNDGSLKEIVKAYHVPSEIAARITKRLTELYRSNTMSKMQYMQLQHLVDTMNDIVGNCERIRASPIPHSYDVHLKRYTIIFILMLPFSFIHYLNEWSALVAMLVYYAEAGLEAIGEEIEDPFGQDENDLPIDALCISIKKYAGEMLHVKKLT